MPAASTSSRAASTSAAGPTTLQPKPASMSSMTIATSASSSTTRTRKPSSSLAMVMPTRLRLKASLPLFPEGPGDGLAVLAQHQVEPVHVVGDPGHALLRRDDPEVARHVFLAHHVVGAGRRRALLRPGLAHRLAAILLGDRRLDRARQLGQQHHVADAAHPDALGQLVAGLERKDSVDRH